MKLIVFIQRKHVILAINNMMKNIIKKLKNNNKCYKIIKNTLNVKKLYT